MESPSERRRLVDGGLQPERTSLAWFRTVLAFCSLAAFSLRTHHSELDLGLCLAMAIAVGSIAILYASARRRGLQDVTLIASQVTASGRLKGALSFAVLGLIALCAFPIAMRLLERFF